MKITFINLLISIIISIIIFSCSSPKPIQKEEIPPKPMAKEISPEITIRFANIDISNYSKKIVRDDIIEFSRQLKRDSIDIVAIQGITRYPSIKSRIDFIDEFSSASEMKSVFGETINLSGRQDGNAVFSVYPIRSSENFHFENLESTGFESAVQAIIDCGVRDILVVSTRISDKASKKDRDKIYSSLKNLFEHSEQLTIIGGNFSLIDTVNSIYAYTSDNNSHNSSSIWFSKNNSLKLIDEKNEQTLFGKMNIVNFGLFGNPLK